MRFKKEREDKREALVLRYFFIVVVLFRIERMSACIKKLLDGRTRKDASTMHVARYDTNISSIRTRRNCLSRHLSIPDSGKYKERRAGRGKRRRPHDHIMVVGVTYRYIHTKPHTFRRIVTACPCWSFYLDCDYEVYYIYTV